jgi:translation initiation factor 5
MNVDHNEFIVNGAHDPDKLLSLLYTFIAKFVLCSNCQNPETTLEVENKKIRQTCKACSHSKIIPNTLHRLTSFIINHSTQSTSKKDLKKNGKKQEANGKKAVKKPDDVSEVQVQVKGGHDDEDDDFGSDDLTEQAYEERMRALTDGFTSAVTLSVERVNEFFALLNDKKLNGTINDTPVQKELINEATRLGLREKGCLLLCEILFTDNIIEEINKYKMLLLRFCVENKKGQKYLLGGLEKVIGDIYKDKLFNKAMSILKTLYDLDILDEDVIIEWASKPSKKYIQKDVSKQLREKIQPFIKWLKEAEVEKDSSDEEGGNQQGQQQQQKKSDGDDEDDEDDDEDDLNIEYSHRVNGIQIENVKEPVNGADQHDATAADDLNIDDI